MLRWEVGDGGTFLLMRADCSGFNASGGRATRSAGASYRN